MRRMVSVLLAVGLVVLVVRVTSAVREESNGREIEAEELRGTEIEGDAEILSEVRERSGNWSRFQGVLVEEVYDRPPMRSEIVVWPTGYYQTGRDGRYEAGIDRVMVSGIDPEALDVFDHRFKPCRQAKDGREGRIFEVDGVPMFERDEGEGRIYTNDQGVNERLAPSYRIRREFERLAVGVEDLGLSEVAGREAMKFRAELAAPGEVDEGEVQVVETLWVDEETGVVLKEIREGEERIAPTEKATRDFRQEWRFEEVSYDEEVTPKTLAELTVPESYDQVRYTAYVPSLDEFVERSVNVEPGTTIEEVLREVAPKGVPDEPRSSCGES